MATTAPVLFGRRMKLTESFGYGHTWSLKSGSVVFELNVCRGMIPSSRNCYAAIYVDGECLGLKYAPNAVAAGRHLVRMRDRLVKSLTPEKT